MKVRIDIVDGLTEDELIIRCREFGDSQRKIQAYALELAKGVTGLACYKDGAEYYFSLSEVLFFETEGDVVYAHTRNDSYKIKQRLYELEELLPKSFVRASKSSIVNTARIHSVRKNLTASSLVEFPRTSKRIYVSRRYYPELKARLDERSRL